MKHIIASLFLCSIALYAGAQNTLKGVVSDAETGKGIEAATIKLVQGDSQRLLSYTFSRADGSFALPVNGQADSLQVAVSFLGYKSMLYPVPKSGSLSVAMQPEAFAIREVTVRPGRLWNVKDTVNYNVAEYLSDKDESIKDVIKKLPGVDVNSSGQISYNGKAIDKLYVEGMDLSDGRYNQITNNLQAKAVDAVQVLNNHQPVKALKNKISTEEIAINLKLRPEFREKWMVYIQSGGGIGEESPEGLWMANINAMQLRRGSQSNYIYKGNNAGIEVSNEQLMLAPGSLSNPLFKQAIPLVEQPLWQTPLVSRRLLFNNTHHVSANRLTLHQNEGQLRTHFNYTRDARKQHRGSVTDYYQHTDTVSVAEESHTRLRSDDAELRVNYEINKEEKYITNQATVNGVIEKGISTFDAGQAIRQQIRTPQLSANNTLSSLWVNSDLTYKLHSQLSYQHLPSTLRVDEVKQWNNLNLFISDHSMSILKKKGYLTQEYSMGIATLHSNIHNIYGIYATPYWQYNKNKWRATLTAPLKWQSYSHSRVSVSPMLSINYTYNYNWQFRAFGRFNQSYGELNEFRKGGYATDYRHKVVYFGEAKVNRNQNYSLYGEYKRTIQEFFTTLTLSHYRGWSNRMNNQQVNGDMVINAMWKQSQHSQGWIVYGTLSKGIYSWRMKAALQYKLQLNKSELLSQGVLLDYRSKGMDVEAKLSWSPIHAVDVEYTGNFGLSGTKPGNAVRLPSLWNITQQLSLSYSFNPFELSIKADHYHNEISSDRHVRFLLADATLKWKRGRWQAEMVAANLLNKTAYRYTTYSALQRRETWVDIRGRECRGTIKFRL